MERRYTKEEIDYIKDHYGSMSNVAIAKKLGRTTSENGRCISRKAASLGLGTTNFYCQDIPFTQLPDITGIAYKTIYEIYGTRKMA